MCRCTPCRGSDGTSSTSRAVAGGAAGAGAADETSGIAPGLNGTSPCTEYSTNPDPRNHYPRTGLPQACTCFSVTPGPGGTPTGAQQAPAAHPDLREHGPAAPGKS
jgi:hypothetical protein